jgi:RND family efflux transporter MFP subunit
MRATWLWSMALVAACGGGATPPARDRHVADAGPPGPLVVDAAAPSAPEPGFVGVLVAAESVDIAPRFEAVVARVVVRAGDHIDSGQLVAELDPSPLEEELRAADAALRANVAAQRQADVDVTDAARRLDSEKAAVAAGTSPRQNIEAAELALDRARAARERARSLVAEAKSRVETTRGRLDDATLRAPFAGTIALRFKDAGATVGPGTPIVRLVGEGGLRLRFAVPPARMGELALGEQVDAAIDTITAPVAAVVRQMSPALDPASGMIVVEAELAAEIDGTALRPGLAARVRPR